MTKKYTFFPRDTAARRPHGSEYHDGYDSHWTALSSIAPKIGCTPEALRIWLRQYERDAGGGDGGLSTTERQRLKELELENSELRRSNDILRQASAYFAKAEFDRLWKIALMVDTLSDEYGVGSVCHELDIAPSSYYATVMMSN